MTIPKNTIPIIPANYWLGGNATEQFNTTTLYVVAPSHQLTSTSRLDLSDVTFSNQAAEKLVQKHMLARTRSAAATLAGVITPALEHFIKHLQIHHTQKTNLAGKIAKICIITATVNRYNGDSAKYSPQTPENLPGLNIIWLVFRR